MIYRDKDKRLRWKVAGVVAALVAAGVLTWAVLPQKGDPPVATLAPPSAPHVVAYPRADEQPAAPAVASPEHKGAVVPAAAPLTKEARFAALTVPGATPAMLSQAWDLAKECETEALILNGPAHVQTSELAEQKCRLPPGGAWQDAATVKRMLEARVARVDFGAWGDVSAHRWAFADDPARWRQLVADAWKTGLANAEPAVTGAESRTVLEQADALHAQGRLEEAQAAYRRAAVYAVASATNMRRLNEQQAAALGISLPPAPLTADARVAAVWSKLDPADRNGVTDAGKALAKNWKASS